MGRGGIAPPLLTSTLDGEWSASRLCQFTPKSHWVGGWVSPRSRYGRYGEENSTFPCRESNHGCPASSPSLYRLSYRGSHRHRCENFKFTLFLCSFLNVLVTSTGMGTTVLESAPCTRVRLTPGLKPRKQNYTVGPPFEVIKRV
jgi:hypothetical protein